MYDYQNNSKMRRDKVCKKIFLILKIPLTYFLPITKKKSITEKFLLKEIMDF